MKFANKVAVIAMAGGEGVIGMAIAEEFHQHGAKIAVFGDSDELLNTLTQTLGGDILTFKGEVKNNQNLGDFYQQVKEKYDHIDILVVNAGIAKLKPFAEVDEMFFIEQFIVNAKGSFFCINLALPLLVDGGNVIVTSSVAATKGFAGSTVYGPSKAAVKALIRPLSVELAPRNIRVNAISPGPIDSVLEALQASEAEKMQIMQMVPLRRMGQSSEVAKLAMFLASDEAAYITGDDILIDGGLSQA